MRRPSLKELGEKSWAVFLLLFLLVFLRFCCYGPVYFPQLDDYIQMHNQAAYYTFSQVVLDMGLLASRPLASVMDVLFWSRFWPHLIWAVALLSGLYALSAVLFRQVWRAYFGTGWIFLTLYTLFPLGMEGTYWLSASTRVVPSLFFTALAMWLFQRWCRTGGWGFLALYLPVQLLSFSFYEQGLVLSVTGVLLVAALEWKRTGRRALWGLLTFGNVVLYFAFTSAFATTAGQLGSRLKLTLPWQAGYWEEVFLPALGQTFSAFCKGGFFILFRGLVRGAEAALRDCSPLWLPAVLLLCALLFLFARQGRGKGQEAGDHTAEAMVVGFLMALAPVTIFFVLSQPSVALRNTVFSFCGLSLMADAALLRLLPGEGRGRLLRGALPAGLALVFCLSACSEVGDYRQACLADQAAARAICQALPQPPLGGSVGVLGLEANYPPGQNFPYHEHIHGATESVWALTGLLTCTADEKYFPTTVPLPAGSACPEGYLASLDRLLLYRGEGVSALPVTLGEDGLLLGPDGETVGRVTAVDGLERLQLEQRESSP